VTSPQAVTASHIWPGEIRNGTEPESSWVWCRLTVDRVVSIKAGPRSVGVRSAGRPRTGSGTFLRGCAARDGQTDDLPIVCCGAPGGRNVPNFGVSGPDRRLEGRRAFLAARAAGRAPAHEIANLVAFQMGRRVTLFGRARSLVLLVCGRSPPARPGGGCRCPRRPQKLLRRKLRNTARGGTG